MDNHFYITQQWQHVRDRLPATLGDVCTYLAHHREQWPASRDTPVPQAPDKSFHPKVTGAERMEIPKDAGRRVPQHISSTRNLLHTSALTLFGALSGR
jgi:hypothetical protein